MTDAFTPIDRETLQLFIQEWGVDPQIGMVIEEGAELIVELADLAKHEETRTPSLEMIKQTAIMIKGIMKAKRYGWDAKTEGGKTCKDRVREELADNLVMGQQLAEILGYDQVSMIIDQKVDRAKDRLRKSTIRREVYEKAQAEIEAKTKAVIGSIHDGKELRGLVKTGDGWDTEGE